MIKHHSEHIYQGNWESVRDKEYLNHSIGAIICLNENNERVHPEPGSDVNYLWCSFNDPGETLTEQKLHAIRLFATLFNDKGILVHCYGGANRSSAISVLLMHWIDGIPIERACHIVKQNNAWMGVHEDLTAKIHQITGLVVRKPQ